MWILHTDTETEKEIINKEAKIFEQTLYIAIKQSDTL